MPRIGEVSLDTILDEATDRLINLPKDSFEDTSPTPGNPSSPKPTTLVAPARPLIRKRFTLLIDPPKMLEKNYPTRKEKARTFLAGLFDGENVEMVHIGWGKKSVEDQITGSFRPSSTPIPASNKNLPVQDSPTTTSV